MTPGRHSTGTRSGAVAPIPEPQGRRSPLSHKSLQPCPRNNFRDRRPSFSCPLNP
ncbi:hypothetical protein [Oxynema aestuarii]|uniref:Uncharacterized protein n=1 Tax=Oxynema aestuarii AP17 TaxID=2064643 RepID=A0A6H1TVI3_9CYAN|nr:hypothetical protein [Oxynema aestuarii]QIZ69339.1 hypothetical protein HCG48_01000 [Oxynema aestuarii AP17]